MSSTKRKIVLAGNYHQYLNYLRETGQVPKDAAFVSRSEQIRGLRDVEVVYYRTWWANPEYRSHAFWDYLAVIARRANA